MTWIDERNAALSSLDLNYARKMFPNASSDDVLMLTLHKARYECTGIKDYERHLSAQWLRERGYGRLHGPLLPEGELPK